MALFGTKNMSIFKLLNNNRSVLLRTLGESNRSILFTKYTSTTSSSKGQSISIGNLNVGAAATHVSPESKPKLDLTFEDSKTAFKSKSNLDLIRGYLVFQLCSINFLINNQKTLLSVSRKLLGKRLFSLLMKSTIYGHFVAGEDQDGIRGNVEKMMKYGVKSILDYSAEEDLETQKTVNTDAVENLAFKTTRKLYHPSEVQAEKNTRIFMDCIDAVSDVTNATGLAAVKLTSLIRPDLLLKFSTLVSKVIQFNKKSEQNKIDPEIFSWNSLMNKSDEQFAKIFNEVKELKDLEIFDANELGELRNMFKRTNELVHHATQKNVRIFVDAEQTYFQAAIHRLTIELMRHYNKNTCIVLNTYQNYLKATFDSVKEDIELANKENFCFGAKLVRGAYMEQERERAKQMNYEDPVNENYEATTKMYEKSLIHCLDEIKKKPKGRICVMVASHNEDTVKFAVEKMSEYNINPADRIVCFGQLLGMCDYISFYLGGVGYSVYKYVPYGPVEEVLPYLSRRATENRGIFEKVKKEKRLILTELKRRFKSFELSQ